jgi:hypothetical protein
MSREVKLPAVIAHLKPIMWDKYRVSWGLDEFGKLLPKSEWKVAHSPAQFFGYALKAGEISQEQFDEYRVQAGSFWGIDLVR